MTFEELSQISCVRVRTIKRKISNVVGVYKSDDGQWVIPDGSRYPYDAHRYKFNNIEKRRIALLDATFKFRYVDHNILALSEESFDTMIIELVDAGYLQQNNSDNKYGANRYDTTIAYEQLIKTSKENKIKTLANVFGSASGHFTGAFLNEMA